MKYVKLSTYTDTEDCKREDIDQVIAGLVRMGYAVWRDDEHICFDLGNDDEVKEKL